MVKHNMKTISIALIGGVIESYNYALIFALFFIFVPLFFSPEVQKTSPLMMLFSSFIVYLMPPLGAIFFGFWGDKSGRKKALSWAIILTAFPMICIGLLPTYEAIGMTASILFLLCWMLQLFLQSGESSGVAVFLMEHALPWNKSLMSSFLNNSLMVGSLLAAATGYFCLNFLPEWGWRVPFLFGGILSFFGFVVRYKTKESPAFVFAVKKNLIKSFPLKVMIQEHYKNFLLVIGISPGIVLPFYMTYIYLPQIFERRFHLTTLDIFLQDASIMGSSIFFLPFVGKLADWCGRKRIMLIGAFCLFALSYFIFQFIEQTESLERAIFLRFLLNIIALLVTAPACAFIAALFPVSVRYTGFSLAWSLGTVFFITTTPYILMFLIDWTQDPAASGGYLSFVSILCWISIFMAKPYSQTTEQEIVEHYTFESVKAA